MEVQDLMRPRVKLIALWPGSENDGWELNKVYDVSGVGENSFENYPHLFKPLAWWEEREIKDMPEYIRLNQTWVAKVKKHRLDLGIFIADETGYDYPYRVCLPATLTEYNDYITHSLPNQGRGK